MWQVPSGPGRRRSEALPRSSVSPAAPPSPRPTQALEVVTVALVGRPPHMRDGVDVGRLAAEGPDRAAIPGSSGERVEGEVPHGVEVGDLVDLLDRQRGELRLVDLRRIRPRAVGVRIVGLPADVVDVEVVDQADPDGIVDEAAEHPLAKDVGRAVALGKRVRGPARVTSLNVLGALQEVRDPADVALGEREAKFGKAPPEVGPHQVAERVDGGGRRQAHGRPTAAHRGSSTAALDEEPTCRHKIVPPSEHAAKSGSQWPEWIEGMCSAAGFSEKVTA